MQSPHKALFLLRRKRLKITAASSPRGRVNNFRLLKNKNQLDATYYFIVLLIGSTCFGRYYVHHQELATVMLITTLVVSFLVCLQSGHYSSLPAPNLQPTANQKRNDQCGNQHNNRELLMMGIAVPEAC